ncbi:hypothetical protein JOM56_013952 [Amanita muscaria]
MAPSKQQALLLEAKFGNFAVHTVDVPGAGEKYGIFVEHLLVPAVLGSDIAGDVEEVDEGITGVSVGDRV